MWFRQFYRQQCTRKGKTLINAIPQCPFFFSSTPSKTDFAPVFRSSSAHLIYLTPRTDAAAVPAHPVSTAPTCFTCPDQHPGA